MRKKNATKGRVEIVNERRDLAKEQIELANEKIEIAEGGLIGMIVGSIVLFVLTIVFSLMLR